MALYKVDSDTADLTKVAGGTLYADNPIGSILPYGGTVAPSGFFLCQGQALSRTEYADLFHAIGTSFGVGDGSTTFNIPDLRGEFLRGAGANSHTGQGNGSTVGTHQDATNHIALTPWTQQLYFEVGGVPANYDSDKNGPTYQYLQNETGHTGPQSVTSTYTSRPTNTSVNYIIKAKHTPIPADFSDSMVGYLGKESNYNLYPWTHERTVEEADTNQNITIERDGWYSIDYTMTSNTNVQHTFTLRDFDTQGEVHTIMRFAYDKAGTFRQTFLVPLKAGTYRYSHGGVGTLSVYMNRRDFAN